MTGYFTFTVSLNRCFHIYFASAGMKSKLVELGDGTTMHCWVSKKISNKPALVLIHGLGANAMWQWRSRIQPFRGLREQSYFFGKSFTTRPERTELFQVRPMCDESN